MFYWLVPPLLISCYLGECLSGHVLASYFPIPQAEASLLLPLLYSNTGKIFGPSVCFFFSRDSLATAVIKLTKWVSNEQKCHRSSRNLRTKQSPYPLPKSSSAVGCVGSQSITAMPLAPGALPLALFSWLQLFYEQCAPIDVSCPLFIITQKPKVYSFRNKGILSWASNTVYI